MATVRKVAAVAPRTVTEVSQGRHTAKKKRKPAVQRRESPSAMLYLKVDPRVWKEALRLAEGEPSRIKIISDTEVVVKNRRK